MAESFSDYKSQMSDWRATDFIPKRDSSDQQKPGGFRNHTFNKYENYFSGYETTMDMPKAEVAKAFSVPILIASTCGLFIYQYGRKPKNQRQGLNSSQINGRP